MAIYTLEEYQGMIADLTGGLSCEVIAEYINDPIRERLRVVLDGVPILYIPPVRTNEELRRHLPRYLHQNDKRLWQRHAIARALQERISLLRDVLQHVPVFRENVTQQEHERQLGQEDIASPAYDLDQELAEVRGVISKTVFSLPEHALAQLQQYLHKTKSLE